jgi:hypothetical protein
MCDWQTTGEPDAITLDRSGHLRTVHDTGTGHDGLAIQNDWVTQHVDCPHYRQVVYSGASGGMPALPGLPSGQLAAAMLRCRHEGGEQVVVQGPVVARGCLECGSGLVWAREAVA